MAITNLTNTKWTFNETLSFETGFIWTINFNSVALVPSYMGGGERTSFTQLQTQLISYMGNACGMQYKSITDGSMELPVYQATWNSTYANENSRTIEITGGNDVENADLIAFLEANAVIELTIDLTGTTWFFNKTLTGLSKIDGEQFNITFTSNSAQHNKLEVYYPSVRYDNTDAFEDGTGWINKEYRTITITGGDDVMKPELIAFLQANAVNPIYNLTEYLTSIADAIKSVKPTNDTINAQFFINEIKNIVSMKVLLKVRGCEYFFYNINMTAEEIEHLINYNDISDIKVFSNFFNNAREKLVRTPKLDYSKGEYFDGMFRQSSLKETHSLYIPNAKSTSSMFHSCYSLQKVDISKLPSDNSYMFENCYNLTTLIIRTMDTIPTYTSDLLRWCYHFTGTGTDTANPDRLKDGRIYVPDDKVEELKATEGWSDFADIIVPLSTLEE